jgi:hypothetical protein
MPRARRRRASRLARNGFLRLHGSFKCFFRAMRTFKIARVKHFHMYFTFIVFVN